MRFLPNSLASIDQKPGPSMTRAAPKTARTIGPRKWSDVISNVHISATTTSVPAMGVHKPASRSIPAPIATDCLTIASGRGAPISSAIPSWMRRNPATTLRRSKPLPGQPLGNMENKRCRKTPTVENKESARRLESPKTGVEIHLF